MRPLALILLTCSVLTSAGLAQTPIEAIPYLGQTPPGNTPVIFAPGVISKGNIHSRLEISSDGREMYWNTVDMSTFSTQILSVCIVDGKWSSPEPPAFAQGGNSQAATFSPDGKKLFFRIDAGDGWVARYVERTAAGWSAPRSDGHMLKASSSFTTAGRVYFSSTMTTKVWNSGIFGARYAAEGYADIVPLDETINVPQAIDYTPYISPDESFLLFASNRPRLDDKEDLYVHVSFHQSDGSWSAPRRVCDIQARFPSLSPDGKYLFFCGDDGNIYWVDATLVDALKDG
ncbi:MAG: hypothetical protein C0395_02060 [Gemmatimonas sp.]|nr:hypothetical protein [Gemmatimonas sp.]